MQTNGLIPENTPVVEIGNEITKKMRKEITGVLEKRIKEAGSVRLFIITEDYPTMNNAESLYFDLGFAKQYAHGIERMVVVGKGEWKKTWIALFGLFGGIETEYFERSEIESAWKWIRTP